MNRSWQWALAAILVAVAVSYAFYALTRPEPLPEGFLYGSGHIEGTEVRIASEVAGRVLEQRMQEGEVVAAGAVLATIDPDVSRDRLSAAQAELDALAESRAALAAQIATWTHHVETARAQVARVERLAETNLASEQSLDIAHDAVSQAEGELKRLEAQSTSLDEQIASAEARVSLGALLAEQGDLAGAEAEYGTALELLPAFGAAYVNLADLYRQQRRDAEAETLLRRGISLSPEDPGLHYALGLTLVRLKRLPEAVPELRRAAELSPDSARYAYVYGMALDGAGDSRRAVAILEKASARHTGSRELLEALTVVGAKAGDSEVAREALRRLEALRPGDPRTQALRERIPLSK